MSNFSVLQLLLLSLIAVCLTAHPHTDDKYVHTLTDSNFEQFIQEHELVLVEFYAPWCSHCKQLAPEYEKAGEILQEKGSKIVLAKVDATENEDTADKYKVEGFPTLIYFKGHGASIINFEGPRESEYIVSWVEKKSSSSVQQLNEYNELKELLTHSNDATLVYLSLKEDQQKIKLFNEIADQSELGVNFIVISSQELARAENIELTEQDPVKLVIYRPQGQREQHSKAVIYQGEWDESKIQSFIDQNRYSLVLEFNERTAQYIFGLQKHSLFLLLPEEWQEDQKCKDAQKALQVLAEQLKDEHLVFGIASLDTKLGQEYIDFIGKTQADLPAAVIMQFVEEDVLKYFHPETQITTESLKHFIDAWKDKTLKPFYKSQELPEQLFESDVKILVGKNFKQEVYDNVNSDILVDFYAPWCQHCQALLGEYEKLAQYVHKQKTGIVIAKIDATANEIENVPIEGYPTIRLFPKDQKDKPIDFDGERTLEKLQLFLMENAVNWNQKGDL